MLQIFLLFLCCLSRTLSWWTERSTGGDQEFVTVERRSPYPADQSLGFAAFGKRYHVTFLPSNKETYPAVPIYASKRGLWTADNDKASLSTIKIGLPETILQDFEVYRDGENTLMVTKRGDDVHLDGVIHQHGDEVFVESSPGDLMDKRSVHMVSMSDPALYTPLQNDYMYARENLGNWLRQRKRDSPTRGQPVTVEMLVVVDNAIYRKCLERANMDVDVALKAIQKYYMLLIYLVDKRYGDIDDPELKIHVRLAAIYVAQERHASEWAEREVRRSKEEPDMNAIDPTRALNNLKKWLVRERGELPNYDHAMAFTGYLLESDSGKQTAGMAYIGTVCHVESGFACSLVEEQGGLANVGTAVHELAHNLGANHDGGVGSTTCSATRNNVMAPWNSQLTSVLKNAYVFSPCTLRQFRTHLRTKDVECLHETASKNRGELEIPNPKLMSPDWQCREVFGQASGQCQMEGFEPAADICLRLWCISPDNPGGCMTRGGLAALYGTPCGDDMVCRFGECTLSGEEGGTPTQQEMDNMTPGKAEPQPSNPDRVANARDWGGQQRTHQGSTGCRSDQNVNYCRQLLSSHREACQRADIKQYCCWTCQFFVN